MRDNREASRYEVEIEGAVAFLEYARRPGAIILIHTEVPAALRGQGIAAILAKWALDEARAEQVRVIAKCPYVRAYMTKHRRSL